MYLQFKDGRRYGGEAVNGGAVWGGGTFDLLYSIQLHVL